MGKFMICNLCTATMPSPHHSEQCLSKSKEELVAIASGLAGRVNRMQAHYQTLTDRITFFQGKFAMLKNENNKLRAQNRSWLPFRKPKNIV